MAGLSGAEFQLSSDESVVGTVFSDEAGFVDFGMVAPGIYRLEETAPPAGFQPNATIYSVVIDADDEIMVDGIPLENFSVEDEPIPVKLGWYIEFYVDDLTTLIGRTEMPNVSYGTIITLSQAQLDAYRPNYYQSGVQVGGPVAVTVDGQVIKVLYLPLPVRTVTIVHNTETAYGSGAYTLNQVTQMSAFDGDILIGSSFEIYLGSNYVFSFASPAQLTVTGGNNEINLYYNRVLN